LILDAAKYVTLVLQRKDISKNIQFKSGQCAIHNAAKSGNISVLQALLEGGVDLNALNQNGHTVLHEIATLKKMSPSHKACLRYLLNTKERYGKLDVNAINNKGYSAVHLAAVKV